MRSYAQEQDIDLPLSRAVVMDNIERGARDVAVAAIDQARAAGHSWRTIAGALGFAYSTVRQRYSPEARDASAERQRTYLRRLRDDDQ